MQLAERARVLVDALRERLEVGLDPVEPRRLPRAASLRRASARMRAAARRRSMTPRYRRPAQRAARRPDLTTLPEVILESSLNRPCGGRYGNVIEAVGNTPLVELPRLSPKPGVRIFAKLEEQPDRFGQGPGREGDDWGTLMLIGA